MPEIVLDELEAVLANPTQEPKRCHDCGEVNATVRRVSNVHQKYAHCSWRRDLCLDCCPRSALNKRYVLGDYLVEASTAN
jgi:hypothetical protein